MSGEIDWDAIPEAEYQSYKRRLEIVELLLDESIGEATKRREKAAYCRQAGVGERTVRNYRARYLKKGPRGLLFYHPRRRSPRIGDQALREKIKKMVEELPTRSVPKIRRLLAEDKKYAEKIAKISDRTIYRFLAENGMSQRERFSILNQTGRRAYHAFEAPHSMALVQGDARDGIWLSLPDGRVKKTYLFLWIDDFSRKILFGKYYLNEKLPCMEDSFKYMILRYGIPLRDYVDNGSVYISRHFYGVLAELGIRQLRHAPYQAHAKGKVEAVQKTVKHDFQDEAALADFHTLAELNSAFWAWSEMEYNKRVHSSTGETPDRRFLAGLPKDPALIRRITDIEKFSRMFLWKDSRTVGKYGRIKLHGNQYPVTTQPHGTVVQVRFDPFSLAEVYICGPDGTLLETTCPSKKVNNRVPNIPQESAKSKHKVSADSVAYFTRLREKHLESRKHNRDMSFSHPRRPKEASDE